jgi:hypothetical protein
LSGITKVEFYEGTTLPYNLVGTDTFVAGHTSEYTFTWAGMADGDYTVRARAYDGGGDSNYTVPARTITVETTAVDTGPPPAELIIRG